MNIHRGLAVAAMVVLSSVARGQTPADAKHVRLEPVAKLQADSMVLSSLRYWWEEIACVGGWRMEKDTIVVERLVPERKWYEADSANVWVFHSPKDNTVCEDSLPMVHTHLPLNNSDMFVEMASDVDFASLEARPKVPFGLLLAIHSLSPVAYSAGAYVSVPVDSAWSKR